MIKRILKKQSKQTYKGKDGKDKHFYNYYLELNSGKRIQIRTAFDSDRVVLDSIADYER